MKFLQVKMKDSKAFRAGCFHRPLLSLLPDYLLFVIASQNPSIYIKMNVFYNFPVVQYEAVVMIFSFGGVERLCSSSGLWERARISAVSTGWVWGLRLQLPGKV